MKALLSIVLVCLPLGVLAAQQAASQPALSAEQLQGRHIFQQKCAVCHLPIGSGGEPYAGKLTRSLVEGREEDVRGAIANGTGPRMPGWKYTLRADQINALIEYLKTVETPSSIVGAQSPDL